jgi:hypothetical protein
MSNYLDFCRIDTLLGQLCLRLAQGHALEDGKLPEVMDERQALLSAMAWSGYLSELETPMGPT